MTNTKKAYIGFLGSTGTVYAFATGIVTSDAALSWLATAAHNQVVQAGFFYMAANWLNTMMTKRNFAKFQTEVLQSINNFSQSMTKSLNNVAEALRADLNTKASRQEVQDGFDKVHQRIDAVEASQAK